MPKRITTNEFIERAKIKHGTFYDYSISFYKNAKTKIKIICKKHGRFEQFPHSHFNGTGCKACVRENSSKKNSLGKKTFTKRAKKIHGDKYSYESFIYRNNTKGEIKCNNCNIEFFQIPTNHLRGSGCPKCGREILRKKLSLPFKSFFEKANEIHNEKYEYIKNSFISLKEKVEIICPKHGSFKQRARHHIKGSGCPICKSSKGEVKILKFLSKNNLKFKTQHKFEKCKNNKTNKFLKFDFYLIDYNLCIEFDGEQHFRPVFGAWHKNKKLATNSFIENKYRDEIKNDFCKNYNIKLLRIPYTQFNNIEEILEENLKIKSI